MHATIDGQIATTFSSREVTEVKEWTEEVP
jgi:hypothetical protein